MNIYRTRKQNKKNWELLIIWMWVNHFLPLEYRTWISPTFIVFSFYICLSICRFIKGNICWKCDGVAQLVKRKTQDPKDRGSSPVRSTRNIFESFFKSKILCWLAVGVPNPHVYTHVQEWSHIHVKDPVVHVRVWWITETQKDLTKKHALCWQEDKCTSVR